jgi:hypothetical protein
MAYFRIMSNEREIARQRERELNVFAHVGLLEFYGFHFNVGIEGRQTGQEDDIKKVHNVENSVKGM